MMRLERYAPNANGYDGNAGLTHGRTMIGPLILFGQTAIGEDSQDQHDELAHDFDSASMDLKR